MKLLDLLRTCLLLSWMVLAQSVAAHGPNDRRITPEEYILQWKDVAVKKMREHGIPASITLAQGLLESGNGNSKLAREGNNHFGIKCHSDWNGGRMYHDDDAKGECFRKYRNAEQSFEDHAAFLQKPRYAALFALKPTDYKGWAHGLKKAGYATDPGYPNKLIGLIERYELHRLDQGIDVAYKPASKPQPAPSRSSGRANNDGGTVTIGGGRAVELYDGRIKFVRAREGDTFRSLARELELTHGMLARWNDLDPDAPLGAGQRIYIQPKRNGSRKAATHTAREGESLWSVGQEHGVKLARLARYNGLPMDARLVTGQQVYLRKPKR